MNRHILSLRGRGNSGKSSTIRLLHFLIIQNGFEVVETTIHLRGRDFRTVFQKDGVRIGITSVGDTFALVHRDLQSLTEMGCIVCVCACRSFDRDGRGTNAAIDNFTNYERHTIDKTIVEFGEQEEANRLDALRLFNEVLALLQR